MRIAISLKLQGQKWPQIYKQKCPQYYEDSNIIKIMRTIIYIIKIMRTKMFSLQGHQIYKDNNVSKLWGQQYH
ncbi:hypothetical protein RhiirB3_445712 [Rhizophagus irregularis]|nr:hypothetical protein RhiirB3_445712 [Rhizophagus irregularis]